MNVSKKCRKPGCTTPITEPHLMCVSCWRSLPTTVQQAVQERLRGWRSRAAAEDCIAAYYAAKARAVAP